MWTYFFIEWLFAYLKKHYIHYKIGEVFSQFKDEIVIALYNESGEDLYMVFHFHSDFPHYKFQKDYKRAKRNSIDLFPEILDLEIVDMKLHIGERSFHFILNDESILIFKLHAHQSNIILKKEEELTLFRNNLKSDSEFAIPDVKSLVPEKTDFIENPNLNVYFPFLDKQSRLQISEINEPDKLFDEALNLMKKLSEERAYLNEINGNLILHKLKLEENAISFSNPLEAANEYASKAGKSLYREQSKRVLKNHFSKKLKKIEKALIKQESRRNELLNNNEWEETANLIMSNLHHFQGKEEAEIFDYYRNENRILKIKKGQSPQKYAETLYRKNKNKGIEIKNLDKSIEALKDQKREATNQLEIINSTEDLKELKAIEKKLKLNNKAIDEELELPYNKFNFQGYDILIGKNAKKNDILTTQIASKNDIWMHAKDLSGSHVVIRKNKKENIPKPVIERAASFASWFSKGRNDSIVPVLYTEKKFVRKGKGLPAGAVKVDKYDVIMVSPEKPN